MGENMGNGDLMQFMRSMEGLDRGLNGAVPDLGLGMFMGGFDMRCEPEPRRSTAPTEFVDEEEIGCICGFSCGTQKALEKHLSRFPNDAAHKAETRVIKVP